MFIIRLKTPKPQHAKIYPIVSDAVPKMEPPNLVLPAMSITCYKSISKINIIQKYLLLHRVLNTFISWTSTILQLIWLNNVMRTNEWNIMVFSMSLSVGRPFLGPLSYLRGVEIKLKDSSKNMNMPMYIKIHMTMI